MTIQELLCITEHRPWELANDDWRFYQEWNNAIFLHWQVELDELREFIPQDLEIDLFDGKPWVSLVAFTMEGVRLRNFPALKAISNFDEINIRTYVRANEKSGVYFLSIEGGSVLSCKIASRISKLPYRFSPMRRTENFYSAFNASNGDAFEMKFQVGNSLSPKSDIDKWLTERYALFLETTSTINAFEIHHLEWPIQKIKVLDLKLNYARFSNLISGTPMITHYSKGVQVLAWKKMVIKSGIVKNANKT